MIAMLIAAAISAAPVTALDAERAFAAEAQAKGQWTAFRHWADPTAVMFEPQAVWVQQALKGRADPPRSVAWAPAQSFVSCDGRTAVNGGAWTIPGSSVRGSFTTVWVRRPDGAWRWAVDSGGPEGATPLPRSARTIRASCADRGAAARMFAATTAATASLERPPGDAGQGRSADGTLTYQWTVSPAGQRTFVAKLWNGRIYRTVIERRYAAPAAAKPRP